ncbi:MAG: FtsK/SpoIIIE family DNA translocase, partial [Planctomycetota bacterium]
ILRGVIGSFWERVFGLALVVACTSASTHLISASPDTTLPVGNGGVIGHALGNALTQNLSRVGTLIVLAASLIVGVLFATEGWVMTLPRSIARLWQASGRAMAAAPVFGSSPGPKPAPQLSDHDGVTPEEGAALVRVARPELMINRSRAGRTGKGAGDRRSDATGSPDGEGVDTEGVRGFARAKARGSGDSAEAGKVTGPKSTARHPGSPKVNMPVMNRSARAEAYPRQIDNWTLPSVSLLREPEYGFTATQEAIVRNKARVLEQTLEEFRLDAHVVEIDTGPVITMFELKLGAGIKVSQVATLSNDIARALKAHAIRVVAPISGKNTVGIEVPNVEKEKVRLKDLMTLAGKRASAMGLPLFLGKDSGGAAIVADLTKMPHLLIAGTTGSGKSVCLNAVIVSMLMMKRPDHVKMIIIDPKMVEMTHFKDVPHLMCPIVTDLARAEKILEWAVTKMEERYEIFAEAGVKNIAGYNNLGKRELYRRLKPANEVEKARISTHLPYVVIIIDELADLMMTSAKEVEHHLCRLAQKSRAIGIHIIVATQRPESKVVTGLIKSNLPARICFRVASRLDSRIVLDQNGGEVLMGQGDLLFLPPGSHKLMRAQGTFLEDSEVRAVIGDLTSRANPEFHPELVRIRSAGSGGGTGPKDPLFDDAARIIIESKRGSVSLLQRRLTIGYSRASRLVDQMADAGVVGDYKGSQAREVLMTLNEWDALQQQVAKDLNAGYEADREDPEEASETASWAEVPALTDDHDIRG